MLAIFFGIIIGLALGLTGGGGSIFAIPLLVYGLGIPAREAITLSLAAVTAVSLFGAATAIRDELIEWRAGLIFAAGGMVAAPLGVAGAERVPEQTILATFALLMLVVAIAMWRKASRSPGDAGVVRALISGNGEKQPGPPCRFYPEDTLLRLSAPCSAALVITGITTGMLAGFFGVGGGFVIVPALMLVTQLSIQGAVATSLFVISLIGISGVISGVVAERAIDPVITGLFIGGGLIGMIAGRRVARHLSGARLQKVFAATMVAVAAVMLAGRFFG